MNKRNLLWLNTFLASVYFTGHLFDVFVTMPNWKNGSVESLLNYRAFFIHADPGVFFRIVVPASVLVSIITFIVYFKSYRPLKVMLSIHLILTLGAFLFTMFYFLPINDYLFWNKGLNLEPEKTIRLAHNWVFAERFRLIFSFIALIASGRALHLSYSKYSQK